MRIVKIVIYQVRLPLRLHFSHARATRRTAENIVIQAITDEGVNGFGEGVPREYVTGETPSSVMGYLANLNYSFLKRSIPDIAAGIGTLVQWEESVKGGAYPFPGAARCALGLSILDATTRCFSLGIADCARYMGEPVRKNIPERVRYSAVLSGSLSAATVLSLLKFRFYGFGAVKLKVGWGKEKDGKLARLARRILGRGVSIRADANGAWDKAAALETITALQKYGISSIEEPLAPDHRGDLPSLRKESPVPIMLDESVCSYADLKRAIDTGSCDMVNIRLSKCGGFFASRRIALRCRASGIGYQLGCQVGESAILSAAGRHFALLNPGIMHCEGSYDRHLLGCNLADEDITFGYGGFAPRLKGLGLGIRVMPEAVSRHSIKQVEVSI